MIRKIHVALTVLAFIAVAAGLVFAFPKTDTQWAAYCLASLAAVVQPLYIALGEHTSRLYRVQISCVGILYMIVQAVIGTVSVFGTGLSIPAVVCGVLLSLAAFAGLVHRREPVDLDPTGMLFVTQLTEMMDTISRATAERECGIYTQMLYEQARFCEPCTDPELRSLEHRTLKEICTMKPNDTDDEIAEKCREVFDLLDKRNELLGKK